MACQLDMREIKLTFYINLSCFLLLPHRLETLPAAGHPTVNETQLLHLKPEHSKDNSFTHLIFSWTFPWSLPCTSFQRQK
jgi:hypothetical protein